MLIILPFSSLPPKSLLLPQGPLFQWGRYETFEFGCTLAFTDPTLSGRSFVTCAFVFVLLLPLGESRGEIEVVELVWEWLTIGVGVGWGVGIS